MRFQSPLESMLELRSIKQSQESTTDISLASFDRSPKNVHIVPVVVLELELVDVELEMKL